MVRALVSFFAGLLGVAVSFLAAWLVFDQVIDYNSFNVVLFTARLVAIGLVGMCTVSLIDPKNFSARLWCLMLGGLCLLRFVLWPPIWFAGVGSAIGFVLSSLLPGRKLAVALLALGVIALLVPYAPTPEEPGVPSTFASFAYSR